MLITADTLSSELRGATPPLLLDLRAAELYAKSRLPGAVHLDLWGLSLIDTSDAPLNAFTWMIGHLFSLRGVRRNAHDPSRHGHGLRCLTPVRHYVESLWRRWRRFRWSSARIYR